MKEQGKIETPWWREGLQLFFRLSCWVAFPAIIGAFIGKYLDKNFHSEPWLFLFGVGFSFIISIVMIIRIGLREMNKQSPKSKV